MINVELPTGKTISMTAFEYYFMLEEKDVDEFYQSCMADDLGEHIDNPFSGRVIRGRLEIDEIPDIVVEEEDIL